MSVQGLFSTVIRRERYVVPMTDPYRVFVVVDRDYGQRLSELTQAGPVWIIDTPANRTVAQQIWATDPNRSHLEGVTTFKFSEGSSPEDIIINELDTIDLHHGPYSANPPYTVLDVIGTAVTPRLKAEFAEFGFNEFGAKSRFHSRPVLSNRVLSSYFRIARHPPTTREEYSGPCCDDCPRKSTG
jgi:hypothetical protein